MAEQLDEFNQTVKAVQAAGFETGVVHAAGSYALMRYDFARMDAVRVGTALLGRCRRVKGDGLQKVGWGEAAIDDIHWLPKGHTVGNETLVCLKRPTRVAVLPVGYQNGFGVERAREGGFPPHGAHRRAEGQGHRPHRCYGDRAGRDRRALLRRRYRPV